MAVGNTKKVCVIAPDYYKPYREFLEYVAKIKVPHDGKEIKWQINQQQRQY